MGGGLKRGPSAAEKTERLLDSSNVATGPRLDALEDEGHLTALEKDPGGDGELAAIGASSELLTLVSIVRGVGLRFFHHRIVVVFRRMFFTTVIQSRLLRTLCCCHCCCCFRR